jgi:hypothetical protein
VGTNSLSPATCAHGNPVRRPAATFKLDEKVRVDLRIRLRSAVAGLCPGGGAGHGAGMPGGRSLHPTLVLCERNYVNSLADLPRRCFKLIPNIAAPLDKQRVFGLMITSVPVSSTSNWLRMAGLTAGFVHRPTVLGRGFAST